MMMDDYQWVAIKLKQKYKKKKKWVQVDFDS